MNLRSNSIPIDQDPPKQPYGSLLSRLAIIAHCQLFTKAAYSGE